MTSLHFRPRASHALGPSFAALWLPNVQRSNNSADGAEDWFAFQELDANAVSVSVFKAGSPPCASGSSSSNSSSSSGGTGNSSGSGGGRSVTAAHAAKRLPLAAERATESGPDCSSHSSAENSGSHSSVHGSGAYDDDERALLAAKKKKTASDAAEAAAAADVPSSAPGPHAASAEGSGDAPLVGLWEAVAGPFDACALATGAGYDAAAAFLQSQVASRMLTWAAAAHFQRLGLDVAVRWSPRGLVGWLGAFAKGSASELARLVCCVCVCVVCFQPQRRARRSFSVALSSGTLDAPACCVFFAAHSLGGGAQVHACHPGNLATRRLRAQGFKDEASGGTLLSGRAASK
jgi:hypothetical protein